MRIAVNTRLLIANQLEGIGWFTNESLKRITRRHPEHEFIFIFDRPFSEDFIFSDNIIPVVGFPQARHRYLWYLFFEWSVPYLLKKYKADIFLSTDGWLSLKSNLPSVNVIHDLNFEHSSDFLPPAIQRYYTTYFPKFAEKATRIATVSEFSKNDIHTMYHIPLDRIDVVYNGCNNDFKPISDKEKEEIRNQYAKGEEYFLFVGAIHKRKNLVNIFKAFDKYKDDSGTATKLIIVGNKKWWRGEIEDTYLSMKYKDDVIFLGRLSPNELGKMMSASLGLVYASLFEGFGIPIVEAFHSETAVITSNLTSMPEVAGDAALLVDPYSVEQIADAMFRLKNNPDLRDDLINKGKKQREKFTWDKTADNLWTSIEKVLKTL
jgi:glycosyltransferase involved in cell wall biosynthesis